MKKILIFLLAFLSIFVGGCGKVNVDKYDFHTASQRQYLDGEYAQIGKYAAGEKELSRPNPIKLDISGDGKEHNVVLKEKGTTNELTYKTNSKVLEVYNLKANTTYEWFIDDASQGEFTTGKGIRNLYIDGITNVRDIGGVACNGGIVKQGLLIRCAKLTNDDNGEQLISIEGIEAFKKLGIKTELDLRQVEADSDDNIEQGGITTSVIPGVNYISFPMASGGNYLQLNRKVLKDLFAILANEDNYPIIFHCSIGTDRTGVVAFLVNALLGVSKEDLYRDYLFSNFGDINGVRTSSTIDDYIKKVTIDEAKSLSENVKEYLINQGVSEEDINKVINIMTEKK